MKSFTLILLFLCFTFLWFVEPWQGDYWYWLSLKDGTLADVFWKYRKSYYGRSNARIGQLFVYFYTYSKTFYIILSNFFLFLTLHSYYKVQKNYHINKFSFVSYGFYLFAILIIFTPDFGVLFFYIPINGNYFVSTALVVTLFSFMYKDYKWYVYFPLVFLSFFAGMGNEHTGLAYLVGFLLVTFSNKLWGKNLVLIISYFLGYLTLLFSPAAHNRLKDLNLEGNLLTRYFESESLFKHAQGYYNEPQVIFLFIAACMIIYSHCSKLNFNFKKCLKNPSVIWFVISLIIIFTIPASPFSKKRLLFAPTFTLACVIVPYLLTIPEKLKLIRQATLIYAFLLTLVMTYKVGSFSIRVNKQFEELKKFSLNSTPRKYKIKIMHTPQDRLMNIFDHSYICSGKQCLNYFKLNLTEYKRGYYTVLQRRQQK